MKTLKRIWRRALVVLLVVVSIVGVSVYASVNRTTFENTEYEGVPTLMDLGAEWCPPCRQLQPILKRMRDRYEGRINIQYYDTTVGEGVQLGRDYGVKVLPTLVFLDAEGNQVQRFEGFRSEAQLELEFTKLGWLS